MLCLEIAEIQMVLKVSSLTQSSNSILKLTPRPKYFLFSLIGLCNLLDGMYYTLYTLYILCITYMHYTVYTL